MSTRIANETCSIRSKKTARWVHSAKHDPRWIIACRPLPSPPSSVVVIAAAIFYNSSQFTDTTDWFCMERCTTYNNTIIYTSYGWVSKLRTMRCELVCVKNKPPVFWWCNCMPLSRNTRLKYFVNKLHTVYGSGERALTTTPLRDRVNNTKQKCIHINIWLNISSSARTTQQQRLCRGH